MALQKIATLLGTSSELKGLAARTRRLRELQTLYLRSAPRELAEASRVKNLRAGTLFISADNAAVAAKLRQLAPTVLASIRKTEGEITGIRIEVQVSGALHERRPRSRKTPLSSGALEQLEALSKRVANEDLSAALTKLVQRRRGERSS